MDDDQQSAVRAETQYHESILPGGVIGVMDKQCLIILKDMARLVERNAVFGLVGLVLGLIPGVVGFVHPYDIPTMYI
jgi:hypothetical protein